MIKNWKHFETFTIFDFFRRGQNLSIFYQLFIDFLSCFFHFPRKQRKMNKNYQKMMKNDKKWKKTRDIHHFWLFPKQPSFLSIFYRFVLSIFYHFPRKQRKMNKNYQKMMKNDKKMIKQWKKLETFTIFDCFRRGQNLSIFYQCFIDFFPAAFLCIIFLSFFLSFFPSSIFVYHFLSFFIIFFQQHFCVSFFHFFQQHFWVSFFHFFTAAFSGIIFHHLFEQPLLKSCSYHFVDQWTYHFMYVCMYACMHACMYVCRYVCNVV